jgi:hypothetical protein
VIRKARKVKSGEVLSGKQDPGKKSSRKRRKNLLKKKSPSKGL